MKKTTLTLEDLLDYVSLSAVRFAPGGRYGVFATNICDIETNGYRRELYLYSKAQEAIAVLPQWAGLFAWEDETRLLLAQKEAETASTGCIVIDVSSGKEAERFSLPVPAEKILPLGGGKYAVTVAEDWGDAEDPGLHRDYEIFEELPLRQNAVGYVSGIRKRLYLVGREGGKAQPVTGPLYDVEELSVTPDGASIVYSGREHNGMRMLDHSIWRYDLKTGKATEVLSQKSNHFLGFFDCDNDGVVYTATDRKRYGFGQVKHIYRYDFKTGKTTKLAACDRNTGMSEVVTDCRIGALRQFQLVDGELYFGVTDGFDNQLRKLTRDGSIVDVLPVEGSVECFDIADGQILYVAMKGLRLQELYCCGLDGADDRRISHFNDGIFEGRTLSEPEHFVFQNTDGLELDGWIIRPVGWDPNSRKQTYPAILDVHGGPRLVYGRIFYNEMQYWANQGYYVVYCNPRGSSGKGDAFSDLWNPKKLGQWDYNDLMEFTDQVLRRCTDIDPARLGVVGGSYGGFMTNWIIGHTGRFAAAASQRSISNWFSNALTSDNGYYDWDRMAATDIWTDVEALWDYSPVKYLKQVTTPTLFLQAFEDYRCPFEQGLQMFTGLKMNGVETRMCAFYDENHELSRSGKPRNRLKRLGEMTAWFDRHLKAADDGVPGEKSLCEEPHHSGNKNTMR